MGRGKTLVQIFCTVANVILGLALSPVGFVALGILLYLGSKFIAKMAQDFIDIAASKQQVGITFYRAKFVPFLGAFKYGPIPQG